MVETKRFCPRPPFAPFVPRFAQIVYFKQRIKIMFRYSCKYIIVDNKLLAHFYGNLFLIIKNELCVCFLFVIVFKNKEKIGCAFYRSLFLIKQKSIS